MDGHEELWRLPTVLRVSALSKSQLYRRMRETDPGKNPFPSSRPFRGGERGVFWRMQEVRAWQEREIGDIEDLLG
jgi:predicted DNA-binding transcriptional regulator AlpA